MNNYNYLINEPTGSRDDSWSDSISDAVNVFLHKGLFMVVVYVIVFFEIVAFLWYLLLTSAVGNYISSANSALDLIGSIFIFIYFYVWLMDYITGYSDGPRKLRGLMNKVRYLGMQTAAFIKDGPQISNRPAVSMDRAHIFTIGLLSAVYEMFMMESRPYMMLKKSLYHYYLAKKMDISLHDPGNLNITTIVITEFRTWVHQQSELLKEHKINVLDDIFKELIDAVNESDTMINVRGTTIFKKHLIYSMYLYFFIWIPITMQTSLDTTLFFILYPLIMYILTGPYIYRKWMGEAFQKNPTIVYNDFSLWFLEYSQSISRSFE